MPTLDQILSANLPGVPTLPFETTTPTTIPAIEERRAGLKKPLEQAEVGKAQAQQIAEAGRLRKSQLEEEAARKKEIGLLEIEAKRPIPKELPEFVPPKQTFDELFSMLMVGIGTGTGAGRGNYMIAANAMIGAMEGYQKGKKDQLNNAIKEFDIAVKRANQEEKINTAKYNQIAANDKIALGEKIRQISLQAKAVDDRVMSAIARTGDFDKVIKEVTRRNDSYDKIEQKRIEAEDKLREHNRRMAESRASREGEILVSKPDGTITKIKEVYKDGELVIPPGYKLYEKGKKDDEGRLTVSAEIKKSIRDDARSVSDMTKVLQDIKDPEIRQKWQQGSTQIARYLAEYNPGKGQEDSLFTRFVREKSIERLDPKVRDLVITIMQARNDYYKQKNGTAVSGSEASRSFGAVIQPTDSLDTLAIKARNAGKAYAKELEGYAKDYVLGQSKIESLNNTVEEFRKAAQTEAERLRELEQKRGAQ